MCSMVMIKCPVTGRTVPTDLLADMHVFARLRIAKTVMRSPACGGEHAWLDTPVSLARVVFAEGSPISTGRCASK
jgi:hypothetical protein